jgi:2-haloacid dehalogenase
MVAHSRAGCSVGQPSAWVKNDCALAPRRSGSAPAAILMLIGPGWFSVGAQVISPRWVLRAPAATDGCPVHSIYRRVLDAVLQECGLSGFSDGQREVLTLAWERLMPWPDAVPGLTRMKRAFPIVSVSNADVRAAVNLSKRAGLPWAAIFAAEMAGVFKPDPAIYRMAATYLGLEPPEIMMVASHKYDIAAAGQLGFQTAFVARPLELGAGGAVDVSYDDRFDINAADFLDLADQLAC